MEEVLENIPYALEERSPYARREEKSTSKVDKSAFKGDCRDAYLDDLDADLLLSGSDGFKPAADNRWDERCSIKQVHTRYVTFDIWYNIHFRCMRDTVIGVNVQRTHWL